MTTSAFEHYRMQVYCCQCSSYILSFLLFSFWLFHFEPGMSIPWQNYSAVNTATWTWFLPFKKHHFLCKNTMYIYFHSLQSPYVSLQTTIFTKEERKLGRYLVYGSVRLCGIWKIKPNSSLPIHKKNILCLTESDNTSSKQGVYI